MARKKKKDEEEYESSDVYGTEEAYKYTTEKVGESKYVVKIIETVDFDQTYDGEIVDSNVKGEIIVKNEGEKDRIWDIDIELSGGDNTDLKEKKFHIPELDPQEDWNLEYNIDITADVDPPLKISEEIDTFTDTDEDSHSFILDEDSTGQNVKIAIKVENTRDSSISEIEITKEVPDDFKDVKIVSRGIGDATFEDGVITWTIDKIDGYATTELEFSTTVYPTEIKSISSGEIKIKYMLESGTYSELSPDFIDGLSEEIHFIDRDERDEEPDVWDCQLELRNQSEFPMKLQKYEFVFGDENTEFDTISAEPDVIIGPGSKWASEPWDIDSEDEPTFSEKFLYTVQPKVETNLSMSATIQPIDLIVLAIEGTKIFSENEIRSYRSTTLDVTIDVKTRGKAPIDVVHMEDTIPADFKNPEKEEMEILIEKKAIPEDDFSFTFDPDDTDDIDLERKMHIEIKDILENIGELDDETSIVVKYPLNAVKPARDAEYGAPVLFQAYTKPIGPVIETYIEPEPISVVHTRRRTRIGKSVRPGASKGVYDIYLLIGNRGDAPKTNVPISDFVPSGFKLIESDTEYEEESIEDGTKLTWVIEEIPPDEEVEINYTIEGEGEEYSLKNIEAKAFK